MAGGLSVRHSKGVLFCLALLSAISLACNAADISGPGAGAAAPHRVFGVAVAALDPVADPGRGPAPDYGMKVVVVQAGSAAASSGIAVGDILLSLDGEPILRKGDIQRIVASRADGSIVSVHLVRNGTPMDIATQL